MKTRDFQRSGFTMIEIMVVIAIAAVLLVMAVPMLGVVIVERPIQDTTKSIMRALEEARKQAILNGTPYDMVIHPFEYTITISPGTGTAIGMAGGAGGSTDRWWDSNDTGFRPSVDPTQGIDRKAPAGPFSIHEEVVIEMIAINYVESKDFPEARVRFYPNGTSDKFTMIFSRNADEWRGIHLDMISGRATFETEPRKFQEFIEG